MKKKITKTEKIKALLGTGRSVREIAKIVKTSPAMVYQVRKQALMSGIELPKPSLWQRLLGLFGR
ncbi:MAG: hypothetical protein AMK69_20295 [Nitrospira bacterium SG8_3]|nr:MAG: hypothetical protein AMK69_20295 [Nitrospira bacterium SG8_3]